MAPQFTLREMQPSDSPALVQLMETDPETTEMSMTTRFVVDPYQTWSVLKPGMVGVVAQASDTEALVGSATVGFETLQFEGRVLPSAHLENLKVHHLYRGHALATNMEQWLIDAAHQRFGEELVIWSAANNNNTASLATMKKWCKQFVGPYKLCPRQPSQAAPEPVAGLTVRAAEPSDLAEIAEKSNRFFADYNLYAPRSAEGLAATLGAVPDVYHYHVAVDDRRNIVAGALLSNRAKVMYDEFQNVPPPMRMSPAFPVDGRLRLLEVGMMWAERVDAAEFLWDHIAWDFRDSVNTLIGQCDPRSPLGEVVQRGAGPRPIDITFAISGPVMMDDQKLVALRLRG